MSELAKIKTDFRKRGTSMKAREYRITRNDAMQVGKGLSWG